EDASAGLVSDLLAAKEKANKGDAQVYTASLGDKVSRVVELMKSHDISQLPVLDAGRVVGIINETDVLDHLLQDGVQDDLIDELVEARFAIVEPTNRVKIIGQFFNQNKVVVVVDEDKLVGIITKIDYIDYVSRQI